MPRMLRAHALICLLTGTLVSTASASTVIHVSKQGDNANPGTAEYPLADPSAARDLARSLRNSSEYDGESIHIVVHGGIYQLAQTLTFNAEDSGSESSPVSFSAAEGEEVIFSGGFDLSSPMSEPTTELLKDIPEAARSHVKLYAIPAVEPEAAHLNHRHIHKPLAAAPLEVFSKQGILPRSGWPNRDWAHIPDQMDADGAWPTEISPLPHEAHTVWAHGFWSHDWEDRYERVHVHASGHKQHEHAMIRLHEPTAKPRPGARYRLENVLSQLNSPGEWFFDADKNIVYVWPPAESDSPLCASQLETVVSIYDTEHFLFEGISVESARVMGIEVCGGRDVTIRDCKVSCIGNVGINVYHGTEHRIAHCEIMHTGSSAVRIEGGDRQTLEACNHVCECNDIYQSGYSFLARRPAVALYGVGIQVVHNTIHDLPDVAIGIHGNEHEIAWNQIYNVCKLTSDSGAVTLSHDPTYRGNKIRFNHIHDIGGFSDLDIVGIYLDDFASGTLVEGNLLRNTIRGIVVGGGRDNVLSDNIILDCKAAIQIDSRGTSWAADHVRGDESSFAKCLSAVSAETGIYADRYPQLKDLMTDSPELAKGNVVRDNLIDSPIRIDLQDGASPRFVKVDDDRRDARSLLAGINRENFIAVLHAAIPDKIEGETHTPAAGRFVHRIDKTESVNNDAQSSTKHTDESVN